MDDISENFFLYIVESPSATDLYRGRSEGSLLARAMELHGVPSVIRTVTTADLFLEAMKEGLAEARRLHKWRHPFIHLSSHGSERGIQLSNNEFLTWENLLPVFCEVNQSLGGCLLLCVSACEGFQSCQMAMQKDGPHPFAVVVGYTGKPRWADTAVAFLVFYHLVSKGKTISDAVKGMKIIDDNWWSITSYDAQVMYLKTLQGHLPDEHSD